MSSESWWFSCRQVLKVSKRDAKFIKSWRTGKSHLTSSAFETWLGFAITYKFPTQNEWSEKKTCFFISCSNISRAHYFLFTESTLSYWQPSPTQIDVTNLISVHNWAQRDSKLLTFGFQNYRHSNSHTLCKTRDSSSYTLQPPLPCTGTTHKVTWLDMDYK